jgi:RimJ/RimL family protein N-acetyltransferase
MIDELVHGHRVRSLTAVLKRDNFRSRRLLERLGFSVAPGELRARLHVDDDELLMGRDAGRR